MNKTVINLIKTYSGILSITVTFITLLFSLFLYGNFDINIDTISDFAINDNSFFVFNSGMIIGIILNIIFVYNLKTKRKSTKLLLYFGLIGLNGLLIFPTQFRPTDWNIDRILHWIFTVVYFIGYSLGILIYSLDLKKKTIKTIALVLSGMNLMATILFLILKNKALTELSSIVLIGIWIIYISIANRKINN